jgi:hypothetical protein
MQRRAFLLSLATAAGALSKSWDQPQFPNWSREFADKLLTDSPWAHPLTVPFVLTISGSPFQTSFSQIGLPGGIGLPRIPGVGLPGGSDRRFPVPGGGSRGGDRGPAGTGVKTEAYLTIRWSSALPIRQALALEEFGAAGLDSKKARELLEPQPKEHLIHIAGIPTVLAAENTSAIEEKLLKTAYLSVKGRLLVRATAVEVPEHGTHLMAALHFPRVEELSPSDGEIELYAEAGPIKIQLRSKLKSMVYNGVLEL